MRASVQAFLVVCAVAAPAMARAEPPVWVVKSPTTTITIFGIIPNAPKDLAWKQPALDPALAGAKELWFEAPLGLPDPLTAIRLLTTMNTQGYLPNGETLSTRLSPEGRARLARAATKYNIPMEKLDRMRPWRADVALALARKDGSLKGGAVEGYAIDKAPRAARRGFDSLEDDLKLVVSCPEAEQVYNLELALRRAEDPSDTRQYARAWAEGDLGFIARERSEKLMQAAPQTYAKLRTGRHLRWAERIAAMAKGSKPVVALVEVANMVGPESLPAILRKKGLQVEGP